MNNVVCEVYFLHFTESTFRDVFQLVGHYLWVNHHIDLQHNLV